MGCCTHVILDLPWDDDKDMIETARVISALGVDQVKLHALYIVKNTKMAQQYENKEFEIISCEHYKQRVIDFLEHLSPNIVLQRLIGRAPSENTLFSNWQTGWWKIRDEIVKEMEEKNLYQGRLCNYLNGSAVQKFLVIQKWLSNMKIKNLKLFLVNIINKE